MRKAAVADDEEDVCAALELLQQHLCRRFSHVSPIDPRAFAQTVSKNPSAFSPNTSPSRLPCMLCGAACLHFDNRKAQSTLAGNRKANAQLLPHRRRAVGAALIAVRRNANHDVTQRVAALHY